MRISPNFGTASPLLAESRAAGLPVEKHEVWRNSGVGEDRDLLYTKMFLLALGSSPGLCAVTPDLRRSSGTTNTGPRSPEAYHALHAADGLIKEVKEKAEQLYPGKVTLLVVSDHGFVPYWQKLQPNNTLKKAGLFSTKGAKNKQKTYAISQGGSAYIYINDKKHLPELTAKIKNYSRARKAVDLVLEAKDFAQFGLPTAAQDPRMGDDLIITVKDGYSISDGAEGDKEITDISAKMLGAHGHQLPLMPQNASVLHGVGCGDCKKGVKLDEIKNLDVAPTVAVLLGLEMKNVQVLPGLERNSE